MGYIHSSSIHAGYYKVNDGVYGMYREQLGETDKIYMVVKMGHVTYIKLKPYLQKKRERT